MKHEDTNFVFDAFLNLLKSFKDLNMKWFSDVDAISDPKQILELTYDTACSHLSPF